MWVGGWCGAGGSGAVAGPARQAGRLRRRHYLQPTALPLRAPPHHRRRHQQHACLLHQLLAPRLNWFAGEQAGEGDRACARQMGGGGGGGAAGRWDSGFFGWLVGSPPYRHHIIMPAHALRAHTSTTPWDAPATGRRHSKTAGQRAKKASSASRLARSTLSWRSTIESQLQQDAGWPRGGGVVWCMWGA